MSVSIETCAVCSGPLTDETFSEMQDDYGNELLVCEECLESEGAQWCWSCERMCTFTISARDWDLRVGGFTGPAPADLRAWTVWCNLCVGDEQARREQQMDEMPLPQRETVAALADEWVGTWDELVESAGLLAGTERSK